MSMTVPKPIIKRIIHNLIHGEDYRVEVVELINAEFFQYAVEFFKKVVDAKLANQNIDGDWYKREFLNTDLSSEDIAINAGLNKKTISNMYNTANREVVIEASNLHYDHLQEIIQALLESQDGLDITLTIKFNDVSVDLTINESLIVINTLAVKRAALRGGLWSAAGKGVEGPLMLTLCKLFGVDEKNYDAISKGDVDTGEEDEELVFTREIDFFLINKDKRYKCEVKLMGKGNPESADAVIARDSSVFIADKLSETNRRQLNQRKVEWVELRSDVGYKKFDNILSSLKIPHKDFKGELDVRLEEVFTELLD